MLRPLRALLLLPALIVVLAVLPSVAFSRGDSSGDRSALYQTISPLPTQPGTVPPPTATPTRRPYPTATPWRKVYYPPPPTPTLAPTPTATPRDDEMALIDGVPIRKIIGDRLSSTLYAYTFSGWLYRSPDDGATWQLVTTQPAVPDFVMSAADPAVLYSGLGADCGGPPQPPQPLYKSVDGGVNWSQLPGGENLRPLLAHAGDANSIFAAGCDGPYLSTDGGHTWTAKPDHSPDNIWQTYRVVEMASASLVGDPRPASPTWGQIIAGGVATDGSGIVVFSNDLGDSWVRLTPNVFPASWGMNSLALDVFTEGLVAFAEPRSVWQTANYGINWQVSTQGLETVAQRDLAGATFGLNDLVYHPTGRLYLATVRGLYSKEFDAQVWAKVAGALYDTTAITSLLYTETNPTLLWLNTEQGVYIHRIQ